MTKFKFKEGDKVKAIGSIAGVDLNGLKGTVVHIYSTAANFPIGVEFEKKLTLGFHNCNGHGRNGHCRYGSENEFELISRDWDD